jgi:hypothetical protein
MDDLYFYHLVKDIFFWRLHLKCPNRHHAACALFRLVSCHDISNQFYWTDEIWMPFLFWLFAVARANFQLAGGTGGDMAANLDLCTAEMSLNNESYFYMPNLLRHSTLVHTVSSEWPVPTSNRIRTYDLIKDHRSKCCTTWATLCQIHNKLLARCITRHSRIHNMQYVNKTRALLLHIIWIYSLQENILFNTKSGLTNTWHGQYMFRMCL